MGATELVRALAVAWSTKQLYPNPLDVPSFKDAVQKLRANADDTLTLKIGLDGFEHEGEIVEVQQAAAARLAQALFAAEVDKITIASPPSEQDVLHFLTAVEQTQEEREEEEEEVLIPALLGEAEVKSIRVRLKDLLDDSGALNPEVPDLEPDIESIREALSAEQEAADFLTNEVRQIADGSDEQAAVELDRRYAAAWEAAGNEDDWTAREQAVQLYTDVYMQLSRGSQKQFLAMALSRRDDRMYANFIDQFASSELAELAVELDASSLDMLIDYARVVSEEESGRDEMRNLTGPENIDLDLVREGIAGLVGKRLEAVSRFEQTDDAIASAIRAELEAAGPDPGVQVATALLGLEEREERRSRLNRIWAAKVHNALNDGDFVRGLAWLNAIDDDGELSPAEQKQLREQIATGETLMGITLGDHPQRHDLIEWFARHSGGELVGMLAEEEDQARRRMLIDVVAQVAKVDLAAVLPSLGDDRWYVVRNVVLALGKSRQRDATEPLIQLLGHDDHRVRIEVLRAVLACGGEEAVELLSRALRDSHIRVRSTSADMLLASGIPSAQRALIAAANDESMDPDERIHLIALVGKVESPEARRALEAIAKARGGLLGTGRMLKKAARKALGGKK